MQMALEALELYQSKSSVQMFDDAVKALRQALETEQEPVAWRYKYPDGFWRFSNGERVNGSDSIKSQALYTAPPKREWVGLTEREVELIDEMIKTQLLHAERCDHMENSTMAQKQKAWDLERVELLRKLKEKNT
jgi:hypothetical protein